MKILVSLGRGGTGKTSFAALMAKYFIEKKHSPLLLVDIDPDQNLDEVVGISLKDQSKKTISELVIETFIEEGGTTIGIPPSERIESRIWEEGLYEGEKFDLIAIGPKWIEGCYCLPDASLKRALERLTKNYKYIIIDSPAGLEHLNRKISSEVDSFFDLIDPSKKSFEHLKRAYRIVEEVGVEFENFFIVGGYRFPEFLEKKINELRDFKYLGKISYDKNVEDYGLLSRSLLEIPETSPAYQSVKSILSKAGYI